MYHNNNKRLPAWKAKMNNNKYLEISSHPLEETRPNRLCVSLSDIHLTDGSVGLQNLRQATWDSFYACLAERCRRYEIEEMTFVIDGDVVDMIRTDKWAKKNVYPWQRDDSEFPIIVNEIIRDIVDKEHKDFFSWLRALPEKLKSETEVKEVCVVVLLGNHDKELLCDEEALTYFYEQGLGLKLENISDDERRRIGRMYGDEQMFVDKTTAPYLPFYYGDCGFRFFTTHGQWRDADNSRHIKAKAGLPSWSAKDGWKNEEWQQLKFSPFFEPCFGDTVAAGVLSTFIYKAKTALKEHNVNDDRLLTILDEMDLYRPTYKALVRLLEETKLMREKKYDNKIINIIENTLYRCIIQWLSWDFTYTSSPWYRSIGLRLVKFVLKFLKLFNIGLEIKGIAWFMRFMGTVIRLNPFRKPGVSFKEMKGFPAFLPEYQHYGFQIHGEGHTHHPLEEEVNFDRKKPCSYINFGTWRDQVVGRKNSGYRRRSILREFYILDLIDNKNKGRSFNYFSNDLMAWSDKSDDFSRNGRHQPHI